MKQIPVTWRGEDDPARVDHAVVRLWDDGMSGHGTSVTDDYALSWSLDASDGWCTRALDVSVYGDGWCRTLALSRSPRGIWAAETRMRGDAALPPAGLEHVEDVAAALDCDLGLCPATNTMPIRRLAVAEAAVPATSMVMALVEVPSLRVVRSEQVYRSAGRDRVEFRSGDFRAELTVDDDGLIVHYPGLARRVP